MTEIFQSYAWPGGYPVYHVTHDGASLCAKCANENGHRDGPEDGWLVIGSEINWEDTRLYCEHCNARIESAYAEEEGR